MEEKPEETGIVVYQPEAERFRISLRPSAVGISAGMVAANITHTIMDRTVQAASSGAAAGVHVVGYVAEKIAEAVGGPMVGLSVLYARHTAADTARNSIRAYSPLTSMITSAAVGATTAYAVTAGEAAICVAAPAVARGVRAAASAIAGSIYERLPSRESIWSYLSSKGVGQSADDKKPEFGLLAEEERAAEERAVARIPSAPPPTPALLARVANLDGIIGLENCSADAITEDIKSATKEQLEDEEHPCI